MKSKKITLFAFLLLILGACGKSGPSVSDSLSVGGQSNTISDNSSPSNPDSSTSTISNSVSSSNTLNSSSGSSSSGSGSSTSIPVPPDPNNIQVILNYNDGKTANKIIKTNTDTSKYGDFGLVNPTRTGYIFKGWFIDNGSFSKQITADHPLYSTSDHNLIAKWYEQKGQKPAYDVTYNFENEKGNDTPSDDYDLTYIEGTKPNLLFHGAFIGNGTRNRHKDLYSVRMRKQDWIRTEEKVEGLEQISFYHAPYAPNPAGTTVNSTIYVQYSVDLVVWSELDVIATTNKDNLNGMLSYQRQGITDITYGVYVRIWNSPTAKKADDTANIDNLRIMGVRQELQS